MIIVHVEIWNNPSLNFYESYEVVIVEPFYVAAKDVFILEDY